jgi:hypothetical protein
MIASAITGWIKMLLTFEKYNQSEKVNRIRKEKCNRSDFSIKACWFTIADDTTGVRLRVGLQRE